MKDSVKALALFLFNSCLGIYLTYGLFFNSITKEFYITPTYTSLVFGAFAISYSVSSLILGFLTDIYGASRVILLGGILMALGFAFSSFVNSPIFLLISYGILGGLGTGSTWLPTSLTVFEEFPKDKTRNIIGIISAGTPFGTLFFSPIEGILILNFGWRTTFLVISLFVLVFTIFAFKSSRAERLTNKLDLKNALPVFKTSKFIAYYSYYLLGNAFSRTLAMIFVIPLIESKGYSIIFGSLALSLIGIGSFIGRFLTNIKNISEESIASIGFLIQGITTALYLVANDAISLFTISLLFGVGYGAYIPQFPLFIRKNFGIEYYGTIFGLLLTSFGIGALFGPLFQGYMLSSTGGFVIGFLASSILSIIVGLHLIFLKKK